MRHSKKGRLFLSAKRKKNRGENFPKKVKTKNDQGPFPVIAKDDQGPFPVTAKNDQGPFPVTAKNDQGPFPVTAKIDKLQHSKKGGLYLSAEKRKNRGQNYCEKSFPRKRFEEAAAEAWRNNSNPLVNEVIVPDCGTTQVLQLKANDTPLCLDANITVPYIKQEIIEPVVSQTLPCYNLRQKMVNPVVSQNLSCHTLSQETVESVIAQTLPVASSSQTLPVASSSRKSKKINVTKRILPQRSSIDLPYNAVCTERIDEPVPDFLPEKRQWIVKKKVFFSSGSRNGIGSNNALSGKRFMTSGEANCGNNKLYKTRFTYSSSQHDQKPQLGQSIKNNFRTLLIRPTVQNVSSHTVSSGELIPPEIIKVKDEFEVVENEFHESPEAVISSLNQEKWNSSLSGSCLNPVTTTIVRSPSTQWFMNSCTSAVTTETVTTFASTSDKTVCTSTSALSNACLSSTSTTPIIISSYAQPSLPRVPYVSSLPINPALNAPMTLVPHSPAAISNSDLIFNSLLPMQSNLSPSIVTNLPFVANNLNNSSVPTRISDPFSNVNSSLPIQTVVLNQTINSALCDTNQIKAENVLTVFDKDAERLSDMNNATLSDVTAALSGTKGTTLSDTKGTTLSDTKGTTPSDTKGTTLSDNKSTTLAGQNSISLSDRNNATLSNRNSTALFDSLISNEPKQNTTMLSNRIATVYPVGAPWTVLSSNNNAQKQDSLTITMPLDAARLASATVSNDEGSKEKMAYAEKAQQVLGEVADKLSKILPDTSFVKYLTDPDFYFFIGLMPLIHMLSLQQKVQARIIIKRTLYDLAYPATSTSLVTSN